MSRARLSIAIVTLLLAPAAVWAAAPAQAGVTTTSSTLVVNTQFWEQPSDVVAASGLLASCDSVLHLGQAPAHAPAFNGRKLVYCGDGTFVIQYQARPGGDGSVGTWTATSGTGSLAGLHGGGTVRGSGDCDVAEGSDGCILDTWTGDLFLAPPV